MRHQHRLCRKDPKYGNPKGDKLRFVSTLDRISLGHYHADEISDPHTMAVAARCLDKQRSELIHHRWGEERCGREGCGPDGAITAGWTRKAARSSPAHQKAPPGGLLLHHPPVP